MNYRSRSRIRMTTANWLRRERITDGSSFLLSGIEWDPVHLWRARIPDQAQHHHHFHVDRTDAEWRQSVLRGFCRTVAFAQRASFRLLRDGRGRRRSRCRTGHYHCRLSHAWNFECGSGKPAQVMTRNPYLWLVPLLPLAGAAINGFFGRKSSKTAISTIALVFCGSA